MTIIKSKNGFDMTIILSGDENIYDDSDVYLNNKASNILHLSNEGFITILKSKRSQTISSAFPKLSSNEM